MLKRLPHTAFEWFLSASIVGIFGFMALMFLDGLAYMHWTSKAYGEVPIPGSRRLHLPAGDVLVTLHAEAPAEVPNSDSDVPIPQGLELVITAPTGAPQPRVVGAYSGDVSTSHWIPWEPVEFYRQVEVAHIPVDGDYTITANANAGPPANPRMAFGYDSPFDTVAWIVLGLSGFGLLVVSPIAYGLSALRESATAPTATYADVALLASGQRARGVLKSFAKPKPTATNQEGTPTRSELSDAPYYEVQVELWVPNRMPKIGRNLQQVPLTEVPKLAVGREFTCCVDTADPATHFVIDWDARSGGPDRDTFSRDSLVASQVSAAFPGMDRDAPATAHLTPQAAQE